MKSFLQGRSVQKSSHLKTLGTGGANAMAKSRASGHGPDFNIETVKEGEKVVRLIITCSCGERIEVDCLYPPGV